jgi:hypothetical protein
MCTEQVIRRPRFTGCFERIIAARLAIRGLPPKRILETSMLREADQHAERIMAMVQSGAHENGDAITRSWSRCLNEYRLHPDRPCEPAIIESAVLEVAATAGPT